MGMVGRVRYGAIGQVLDIETHQTYMFKIKPLFHTSYSMQGL